MIDSTMEEFVEGPKEKTNTPLLKDIFAGTNKIKKIPATIYFKEEIYIKLDKIKKKHGIKSMSEVVSKILGHYLEGKK